MTRHSIRLLLGLSMSLALLLPQIAAASQPLSKSASASLKSLMIRTSDAHSTYGGTFTVLSSTATSNSLMGSSSKVTGIKVSDLVKAGRLSGYVMILSGGPIELVTSLDVFKASSGPRWELQYSLSHHTKIPGVATPKTHVSSVGNVGDQAFAVSSVVKTPYAKTSTNVLEIVFVQGRYLGTVIVEQTAKPSMSAVLKLASTMVSRVRQNG